MTRHQRAVGTVHVGVVRGAGKTALHALRQAGCLKARFPRTHDETMEAVLINTSGGVTDGDALEVALCAGAASTLTVCTPGAEKIYRALPRSSPARISVRARVEAGARLDFLPQETLLFESCALDRTLDVDLHPQGRFLGVEALLFGRAHAGETLTSLRLRDHVRVKRGGRLILHDTIRLQGDARAHLAARASAGGAGAVATVIYAGPDAAAFLGPVREAITGAEGGASTWDGMLLARVVAPDGQALRRVVTGVLARLREKPLPRLWAS